MNTASMQTGYSPSDQAAQVIAFVQPKDHTPVLRAFSDNFDHLQALEYETKLMLAAAFMLRCQQKSVASDVQWSEYSLYFPFLSAETSLEQIKELLQITAEENRQREAESASLGIELLFPKLCSNLRLESFEQAVVLLLFMKATAPQFIDIFKKCQFEEGNYDGMEIGSLLTIISDSLRDHLENRRYFSVDAALNRNNIIVFCNHLDDSTNILNVSVCLHERSVRFILGDNNLYNSVFSGIRRERSDVKLGQVILPDSLKEEIELRVGNYLQGRENGSMDELDDFFGYGTALTLLFHGPSGTGKTMLAQGIANRFGKEIISLNVVEVSDRRFSPDDLLEAVFHEASMHGAIIFLDECDDLFENNSRISRALLIEIEKAHCVVILATNKPVDLDPAMDRRITMKVPFLLPDTELRLEMWKALIPDSVQLAPGVDLSQFAERYRFSGGLIKNSVFMALTATPKNGGKLQEITYEELEKAANLQTASLSDLNRICFVRKPNTLIDDLPLSRKQRNELNNLAKAWEWLNSQDMGCNLLFNCYDIETGVNAVAGLAAACDMNLRVFDFAQVTAVHEDAKVIDPVSQRKVFPMLAAFSAAASDKTITLFVDNAGEVGKIIDTNYEKVSNSMYPEMLAQLRTQKGFFCLVTKELKSGLCPTEFHQLVNLAYPPEELQMRCWDICLGEKNLSDEVLVDIVQQYPMHAEEIKFIARQATVRSIMQNASTKPDMKCILDVVSGYRKKISAPILFGESR
jgi:AAA+ superfamily predicted ATPase